MSNAKRRTHDGSCSSFVESSQYYSYPSPPRVLQNSSLHSLLYLHICHFCLGSSGVSKHLVSVLPELFSNFVGRFLPAAFCAVTIYWTCVKRSLDAMDGSKAYMEKIILWLGGCWVGALANYTLDWIPLQRLTTHYLEQQRGARLSLIVIVVILLIMVFRQGYYFRLERRLRRYLALYGLFMVVILICLCFPGLQLRIHHYILALLLLPGTSLQNRSSLLCEGLLLGLFITELHVGDSPPSFKRQQRFNRTRLSARYSPPYMTQRLS